MNGYANAFSMKDITEDDLNGIENFVKTELEQLLSEKCQRSNKELTDIDKEYFFGLYASCTNQFKLLRGDRKLLLKVAAHLTEIYDKGNEEFKKCFDVPKKYRIGKNDTIILSCGLFYGQKSRKRGAHLSQSDLKEQLLLSLQKLFGSYGNIKPVRLIAEDIIKIVDFGTGIRADIICVFCPSNDCNIEALLRRHAIQYDKSGWNLTNLKRHIKNIHLKKQSESNDEFVVKLQNNEIEVKVSPKHKPLDPIDEHINASLNVSVYTQNSIQLQSTPKFNGNLSESAIMDMPIVLEDSSSPVEDAVQLSSDKPVDTNLRSILYKQFSAQNIRLIEAVLTNSDVKKNMALRVDGQNKHVELLQIRGDGNCLFAALVHQIHFVKISSERHNALVTELRQMIVDHIADKLDDYKQILKGRLIEEDEQYDELKPEDEINADCKDFISKLLEPGEWGGSETMRATSEIFKVNIVVFIERGELHFPCGFNETFGRSIFLAYRLGGRLIHNHYDSVCSVKEELLYQFSSISAKNFEKSCDLE